MKMKAFILAACMLLSSAAVFADTYEEKKQIIFLFMESMNQDVPEGEKASCIASEEESVLGYGSFIFGIKGHEEEGFLYFEINPLDPSMIYSAQFYGDSDAVERDTVADFIRRTDAAVLKVGEYTVYSNRDERYVKTPKGAYLRSKVMHVPYAPMKAEVNPKLKDL